MMIVFQVVLFEYGNQHHAEGERKDEAVEGANEYQDLFGSSYEGEDEGGGEDEDRDDIALVFFKPGMETAEKGNGGISGADNRSDGRRPEYDAEDLITGSASRYLENGSSGIIRIEDASTNNNT